MKKRISILVLSIVFLISLSGSMLAFADDTQNYYVCFSNQNYAIRNANKLTATESDEYILENVALNSTVGFYVTDDAGTKYYASSGDDLTVTETATLNYTIKFSPNKLYTEEGTWEPTGVHVTYSFYIPATYSVTISGESRELTYNSHHTEYDLYYLSSERILSGSTVEYDLEEGSETHNITADGYYRILFTPGRVDSGNTYLFDIDGNYGSGDEFIYHLYIEDAPRYFLSIRSGQNVIPPTADIDIVGESGFLLNRYENNHTTEEYRSQNFFVKERDMTFKYYIYEQELSGSFRLIDDDNDEDTSFSSIEISDVGWYNLSFIDGAIYLTTVVEREIGFGGYYLVGEFNSYNFAENGELDIDSDFQLLEVEIEDEDYNEDYIQYKLELRILESDLVDGEIEFFISDGETKYKNQGSYIRLTSAGRYKILFSDEHIYGRGLNYRYTLIDESVEREEVKIGTVDEFKAFAINCSLSADYSANKSVYLTADIDFSGVSFEQVKFFSGIFYGGYHTLSNISFNSEENEQGIFGTVTKDSTIERVNIKNIRIDTKADYVGVVVRNFGTINELTVDGEIKGDSYVGVVAYNGRVQISGGTTVDSNTVYQRGIIKNSVNNATISGELNVGGLAGFNSGEILSSENNGEIIGLVNTRNGSSLCIGGVAGYSAGKISDTKNNGTVNAGTTSVYVGGLVGILTSEIYLSKNSASVFGGTYVGGNIGYYGTISENQSDLNDYFGGLTFQDFMDRYFPENDTTIEEAESTVHIIDYLINTGEVEAKSYAGGVLGYSEMANLPIRNCTSIGSVESTAGNYAGGIAGYFIGGEIISCMTAGDIRAGGLNGGLYVGGIVGYGDTVRYSMSSANIEGSNYVGGIGGYVAIALVGNYSNVVLIYDADSNQVGSIAGFTASFDNAQNDFGGLVSYNYYVGQIGGVGLRSYGQDYDYAAANLDSDALASKGMLSAYLHNSFSDEYWQGGRTENSYPVLVNFESIEESDEYDNATQFKSIFDKYVKELTDIAEKYSKVTYIVGFMEWNEDNGDLFDGDKVDHDNFELIHSVRLYDGEKLESIPDFVYAQRNGERWIFEGDDAHYYVSFTVPQSVVGNTIIFANYSEIVLSVADSTNQIIVEGNFDKGTIVEVEHVGESMALRFSLNAEEISVGKVRVKYLTDGTGKKVYVYSGSERVEISSEISGNYLSFELENGQYFVVEEVTAFSLQGWAWALIGGGSVLAVSALALLTYILIRKKKSK